MANFGMMNPTYFLSKNILIDWINSFLQIKIEKVEHCATGAIYCCLLDAIHPGCIPMKRVDFTVKQEYDYVKNWKLIQNAFAKVGVKKQIPVERLIKARYQDNLEFLQFMYKYCRDTYSGNPDNPDYDAIGRRLKSKGGKEFTGIPGQRLSSIKSQRRRQINNINNTKENTNTNNINTNINNNNNNNNNMINFNINQEMKNELEKLRQENNDLKNLHNELRNDYEQLSIEHEKLTIVAGDIEKERDFYFNKVLKCEELCKKFPDQSIELLPQLYNVLYQTDDNKQQQKNNGNDNDDHDIVINDNNNDNNNEINNNQNMNNEQNDDQEMADES